MHSANRVGDAGDDHAPGTRVPEVGPFHLTMTAEDGIAAARTFSDAMIVPVHYEGWRHFSESRMDVEQAFQKEGIRRPPFMDRCG